MKQLLDGKVYYSKLNDWNIYWESKDNYRYWCYQVKDEKWDNILVIMFNPGSLSKDGENLTKDTTLRVLREVCENAKVNPFIINLFDYSTPSIEELFKNWDKKESNSPILEKLKAINFNSYIMAYGDYKKYVKKNISKENQDKYIKEIEDKISYIKDKLSYLQEIKLPKNQNNTPTHPMSWQIEKEKSNIAQLLIAA